jgi:trehalose 6-phosphate phosphatase
METCVHVPPITGDMGLFLDVDGTLLDLAGRPSDVVVPASLLDGLRAVERFLAGAVALVSGRTIEDLDRLFAPLRLRAVGVHGAQIRFAPDGPILDDEDKRLSAADWDALQAVLDGFPGTFAENKGHAFAVHYRAVPSLGPALGAALQDFVARRRDLVVMPGHCVFEVKHATHTKGRAVDRLMARAPFAGRIPVFIGDDTTDEAGFAEALARGGRAYSVGRTLPGLTDTFARPAAVREWLAQLAKGALLDS